MSDVEKLRALLAEARDALSQGCWSGKCCTVRANIDAALAEPVDDYDVDADLRLHKEERLRLRVENLRLERECGEARADFQTVRAHRDRLACELHEARAEVERLRDEVARWSKSFVGHVYVTNEKYMALIGAYQRGAEAMREAAARASEFVALKCRAALAHPEESMTAHGADECARVIRALSVLEER